MEDTALSTAGRTFTAEEVVRSLYRAALGRDADASGLAYYSQLLTSAPHELAAVADALFHSPERERLLGSGLADHSQFGELRLILRHLVDAGSTHQLVVDVGARGKDRSNSYDLLADFGWRGLLVEANPNLVHSIDEAFGGLNYTLEACAVGPEEGTLPFYLGANDDVSSLRRSAAESWGALKGEIQVPVVRLVSLLEKHLVPVDFDLLSLDIEGLDVDVLNDLVDNSPFRPSIVIIEASYGGTTKRLEDVSCSPTVCQEYRIAATTEANLILTRR
jgi:FkbM family methyltransferase